MPRPWFVDARDGSVRPRWLESVDHPWLLGLIDEYERFVGRPRRELVARLREPLPMEAPAAKRAAAMLLLDREYRGEVGAAVPPEAARAELFREAAAAAGPRAAVVEAAAARLGIPAADLEAALLADLPGERRLSAPPEPLAVGELALRVNLATAQALVHRARTVRIALSGRAHAVVRQARLRGLLCQVQPGETEADALLELSGPLALFRHTLVYGRALASVLPLLAWCTRFRLEAVCVLDGEDRSLTLRTGDPIFPSAPPRRYDSRVEARFARDFARAAPGWDVVREPRPVQAGDGLIFPDFALVPRGRPDQAWLLEIVGYWTPEYLARKVASLRAARLDRLVLCVDADRLCSGEAADLPAGSRVIGYRRRIDPAAVLATLGTSR